MMYVVNFKLVGGSRGVMVFAADNDTKATQYVADLITNYGHTSVSDPMPIVNGLTDLYRLFHRDKRAIIKGIDNEII